MKRDIGELIYSNGARTVVYPSNGKKFSLADLQKYVGGNIERISLKPGNGHATMYANEDGKNKELPFNRIATQLALVEDYGDHVVGDVLIVRKETR